ncbi:Shedu immune nuclease family protein [Aminobacter sp. Piv2-1]|uniref:Shedu immune nuclease family protein n=1 Tax=Aminobacter sp. Piv2-1 TaxID=3031122 RepID=UPI0030B0D626
MIKFRLTETTLDFEYRADRPGNHWVWNDLEEKRSVTISSVFFFDIEDLRNPPTASEPMGDEDWYVFRFGTREGDYIRIHSQYLGIDNDVLMPSSTDFRRPLFAAERNISIFRRLSALLENDDPIVIGGPAKGAIPMAVYENLLEQFPNTYEVTRYAAARVHTVLSAHLDGMKDARGRYEDYLDKREKGRSTKIDLGFLKKLEIEKYILIRDHIKEALRSKADMSEGQWQSVMMSFLLLLFPKYIKVLENVTISDYYSDRTKTTSRFIDIALVDSNGNLDVIEVKKPFDDKILRRSEYRGNSIPTSELSGSIMQAEKYLFHLSKWGVKGERALTARYADQLPKGMSIRISSPKAIIIVGRDQIGGADMTDSQLLDFEIIKRKYANMIDIITYDDLLRRLNNTIIALGGDVGEDKEDLEDDDFGLDLEDDGDDPDVDLLSDGDINLD